MMAGEGRYKAALAKLETLIPSPNAPRDPYGATFEYSERYLRISQLAHETLVQLPVIHIAGTKGKGSTCAMLEAILRTCGYRTGLFTSPHLCDVRERIRIDGGKIDEDLFAQEVLWLYNRFEATTQSEDIPMPKFFQFMTCVALRLFVAESLDVVILEVGLGGRFDATNVIPAPRLCGITSLGFDHTAELGQSLSEIARHKAGIFKKGAEAFTLPQYSEAMEVLEDEAAETQIPLINVGLAAPYRNFAEIENPSLHRGVQSLNATLAVHMAKAFEILSWRHPMRPNLRLDHSAYSQRMHSLKHLYQLPDAYIKALSNFEWPGRLQILRDIDLAPVNGNPNLTFFLDGAHTAESLGACLNWFGAETQHLGNPLRLLLFNCHHSKDMKSLLKSVLLGMQSSKFDFDHVFFAPSVTEIQSMGHTFQHQRAELMSWTQHLGQSRTPPIQEISQMGDFIERDAVKSGSSPLSADIFPSVMGALGWVRSFARHHRHFDVQMLITGSLYLVGDALKLLGRAPR